MAPSVSLHVLLGWAVLLPLISFGLIALLGHRLRQGAALIATFAIGLACVLSMISLFAVWIPAHGVGGSHGEEHHHSEEHHEVTLHETAGDVGGVQGPIKLVAHTEEHPESDHQAHGDDHAHGDHGHAHVPVEYYTGYWYRLGQFGQLHLDIGYYIDSLTVCMFCMVTLIATCIHFYAIGYMHDELVDEYVDHDVTLRDGEHLKRPGRFSRFFQYLSLFCFSMLGLVISGNIAQTFVFWELVGICSYFLIGFYVERQSASTAANKAFIVNRVGDFGMIIGLMVLWSGLGTFNFGDVPLLGDNGEAVVDAHGEPVTEVGIFSLVRPEEVNYALTVPDGMVLSSKREDVAKIVAQHAGEPNGLELAKGVIESNLPGWREEGFGYGLMVLAGIGIFCGCVGKSAQFPLHTWLPDAMEGPTPVSALVHSATMVAAGVFLAGRFFPVFVPEVLLVIAVVGCITLFMAATIAITATDIKRVLAYSTISQLGYMMLALGVGGWLAGMLHLFTHAFFKSLLFMCSGSVIHAVHTNEMTEMGGLRKKMPVTAYTMLVGCLAIIGAGIPLLIGFSGYYSKDAILEQIFSFWRHDTANATLGLIFFMMAAGGASITAFYMFRLWFMTFAGKPQDEHRYDHAHESPTVMYAPLVVLSVFAVTVAWKFLPLNLSNLLEASRPVGTAATVSGLWIRQVWPDEHIAHLDANYMKVVVPVTLIAFCTALIGVTFAWFIYGSRKLHADDIRRQFQPIYAFLRNKWWFDELYDFLWVRPTLWISVCISWIDRRIIDWLLDGLARVVVAISSLGDRWVDRAVVDGLANGLANWTYRTGVGLRRVQTGRLRQYVMFIVVGTVAILILITWTRSMAGN
ncbi:MAG: NADH-quinone oxidoreductase subunit L [Pirellulaceae bacterium]|nr:NADH-quinone oxidoreductase subunit L [Pirellulaceae bacterium]